MIIITTPQRHRCSGFRRPLPLPLSREMCCRVRETRCWRPMSRARISAARVRTAGAGRAQGSRRRVGYARRVRPTETGVATIGRCVDDKATAGADHVPRKAGYLGAVWPCRVPAQYIHHTHTHTGYPRDHRKSCTQTHTRGRGRVCAAIRSCINREEPVAMQVCAALPVSRRAYWDRGRVA